VKKNIIKILLSFVILTIGLNVDFPIEFQNKQTQIIITHILLILALPIILLNYKSGMKIKRPFNWVFHIINSFFLLVIGYMFLWVIMFDFIGHFPVWTDQKIYINQADTTQIIVKQEYRISGSIISWRERKVKNIVPGIRWSRPASTATLNGTWKFINKENDSNIKDTIVNYKNGKTYKK
jgi:hypothetical protein